LTAPSALRWKNLVRRRSFGERLPMSGEVIHAERVLVGQEGMMSGIQYFILA
jgi:hypothetical protein